MSLLARKWRRKRVGRALFPAQWLRILERRVPYYHRLTAEERARLRRLVRDFLAEITFEGCAGLQLTADVRVTIAAQACILLLNRKQHSYRGLRSVLVYPTAYVAPAEFVDELGVVHEGDETRSGETVARGALVLAWDEVRHDARAQDGRNVVFHEFAHALDQEDGSFNGAPLLDSPAQYRSWARVLTKEYNALQRTVERGEPSVLDEYGATDPAEFFAVATEAFFEQPVALKAKHPQLYAELQKFYRQNPALRFTARARS